MALTIDWSLVATIPGHDIAAGISNIGGRLVAVVGRFGISSGAVWASDDGGLTWSQRTVLANFTDLGVAGEDWFAHTSGLLCYQPGDWLHGEDGAGSLAGSDAGGVLRSHLGRDVGPGTPVFLLTGWTEFGRPCLNKRKDSTGPKIGIWPGTFLYDLFGPDAGVYGTLLLELSQAGATSLTTAFLLHQLQPGNPYAVPNPDGSISWLWVTNPPLVGGSALTPEGFFTDGYYFFMLYSQDGSIWRPYGDNQLSLSVGTRNAPFGGTSYNHAGEAFFLSDGETLLLGVNVSGLSPCIFRSTARGAPGTFKEKVLPGNFFNFVPEGAVGTVIFSGLQAMTHCFCELDDGSILCGGGAPTGVGVVQGLTSAPAYHHPLLWKSDDKGVTWTNISLGVENPNPLPLEASYYYESRCLLAMGGQAAFLACGVYANTADPNWSPFFVSDDGGVTFRKSLPAQRVGMFATNPGDLFPSQATFANDGSIIVVMQRFDESIIEIWRGVPSETLSIHRAVGFVEQADLAATGFSLSIPERELIRG